MIAKMYNLFNASQQQTQANTKAIANMERQIAQMAEDQRKRDSGKLPSTTEINPNHTQRAGKEHVNAVEAEWRKVTEEDLLGHKDEVEVEEGKNKNEEDTQIEKETQVKEHKEVPMDEQPVVAGIKKKKEKKDAPEDTKILQEMCEKNGKSKTPTPDMVRLTVKASEALLGTLPKKERDPGSPLITVMVGDVVIRNTLLDLGASVNLLPGYLYDKYKNEELEPAKTVLQLADKSMKVSRGKLTNVKVKVGDFFYPVDFLVMEYESLEDAPVLILGRPFFATAGAIMDCMTRDLDISFGTSSPLMAPGTRDKCKIWTQEGEGGKEEIPRETKKHPLSTVDKVQLLDMMEMMELKHQQYEKDAQCREAKDIAGNIGSRFGTRNKKDDATGRLEIVGGSRVIGTRQVWGHTKDFRDFENHNAAGSKARRGIAIQPDAQGLDWRHARRGSLLRVLRKSIGQKPFISYGEPHLMAFRRGHPFLQFPEILESTPEYAGLWAELEPFLHRTWSVGGFTFTCHGWERLMANGDDVVYTELLLEFLSTVRYTPASREARS
ncbi:hypothetical protein L2E82_45731 [Cichorium intybus]|uniref:Uncharacterized protein n=1 Tax=Cichorium intybus TaxID=13427 RepID=A0ACB8ZTD2_CICIN|nr:hypothetical protein L2E82_45731 [Cichorium intybus]